MPTVTMNHEIILENLEVSVIVLDQERQVLFANVAAETMFYKSRRRLLGSRLSDLIPNDDVRRRVDDCLASHSSYTLREIELNSPNGEALVDISLSPLSHTTDADGDGVLHLQQACLLELNSIKRISRFMKEKNQMERQQSFRLMMRSLAHEIKNPLGGIRGAAQLLDRELEQASQRELTDILIKEADRLTRLVDRVMGSREHLRPELLNIHEVLEHVVDLVSVKSDQLLQIDRGYDPALPEIEADREQLVQAVLNVVMNAIQAQHASKQIKLGLITEFDRLLTIDKVMYRQVMKIRIWDDGPGVDASLQDILFDPLITNRADGTGLGLSITQEIVQRHKGVVRLEDYQGKTCFTLYLPYINAGTEDIRELR